MDLHPTSLDIPHPDEAKVARMLSIRLGIPEGDIMIVRMTALTASMEYEIEFLVCHRRIARIDGRVLK